MLFCGGDWALRNQHTGTLSRWPRASCLLGPFPWAGYTCTQEPALLDMPSRQVASTHSDRPGRLPAYPARAGRRAACQEPVQEPAAGAY